MTPNHRHHRRHSGMTLVELMVVVAIIVLLGSIMAYFITGSRSQNAQKNMTNDILALINDQRARAIGLNVAAYITFSPTTVQPRLGKTSACTTVATDQLPIRYTSGSVDVAIDFGDVGNKSHRQNDQNQYARGERQRQSRKNDEVNDEPPPYSFCQYKRRFFAGKNKRKKQEGASNAHPNRTIRCKNQYRRLYRAQYHAQQKCRAKNEFFYTAFPEITV